jgi:glyoxylase-like metal-dependent hydrolase (beta-lactamase superfamily II)
MIQYRSFTGGIFETKRLRVGSTRGWVLFDAPEGACDWLVEEGIELRLLPLTHGHIDHIQDVAKIKRRFGCPVGVHPESAPMISDASFFQRLRIPIRNRAGPTRSPDRGNVRTGFSRDELRGSGGAGALSGESCFFSRENELLIGGDVLFAGGVGRWDLPGGDGELLFAGIREKLYSLGDEVTVLPGHGPATTIGAERRSNPFVR